MVPLLGAVVLLVITSGCGAPGIDRWSADWTGAYSRFEDAEREAFTEARAVLDEGRRLDALAQFRAIAAQDPDNLEVGAWLQDVEMGLLRDGVDLFPDIASLETTEPEDVLRLEYARRATEEPTVSAFVLAARVETDVLAAETLIGKALELDPTCAWAHYARSHVLLEDRTRSDRWGRAREALERALALDTGHLRARRLESWMAAQQGSRDVAEPLLGRWIDEADGDPRVSREEAVNARLDLALLLLMRGEESRALRILEDLEGESEARARRWMLTAVARQEGGDALGALDAALRAQGAEGGTTLPLVQEALLYELFLERPDLAERRWEEVARSSEDSSSLADLIQRLRARVRLERSAARKAARNAATENTREETLESDRAKAR